MKLQRQLDIEFRYGGIMLTPWTSAFETKIIHAGLKVVVILIIIVIIVILIIQFCML